MYKRRPQAGRGDGHDKCHLLQTLTGEHAKLSQALAIIMIHSLRALPIDINSSIVPRRANGLNKHSSCTCSRLQHHNWRDVIVTLQRASPHSSTPFSMCSNISTESGFNHEATVTQSFNVLMCVWHLSSSLPHLPLQFCWNMSVILTLIQLIHAFNSETVKSARWILPLIVCWHPGYLFTLVSASRSSCP